MRASRAFLFALVGLVVVTVALLRWQRRTAAQLREEISIRRHATNEWMRVNAERQHLLSNQVKPDEFKKLVADRHAVSALLGEIEAMKRRAVSAGQSAKPPVVEKPVQPALERGPVPASLWKDAGQGTPAAAFETLLWASAGGDLDSLVRVLDLDSLTRMEATEVFDQLPPAMRQEIGTPERFVALMTAKDIPLGSAEILNAYEPSAGNATQTPITVKLDARVVDAEGNAKELLLNLRAENGTWRLVVPDAAITKYAALLHVAVEPSTSAGDTPR